MHQYPHATLAASGVDVGLPAGQMGNSEVGHTNIGAGRIVQQDFTRISGEIENSRFSSNQVLLNALNVCKESGKSLHLMGLLSSGGVQSHVRHLWAILEMAKSHGLRNVFITASWTGGMILPIPA
jgi:2,3-bisphosphoglycerate-independent phosphoglycerate mutase